MSEPDRLPPFDRFACQKCGEPDVFERGAKTVESSGSGYNHDEGQMEYWWLGYILCPACDHKNYWGDSSL